VRKILKNILALVILGILIFVFQDEIGSSFSVLRNKYLPCRSPIAYSLGTFDERFGVSKEKFLESLALAEGVWEKEIDKNLFKYSENGNLKINLIYDSRQEATEKLDILGDELDFDRVEYNKLKGEYEALYTLYLKDKKVFEARLGAFEARKSEFEKNVAYWNQKGGAPQNEYEKIKEEEKWLNGEVAKLNNLQNDLNQKVDEVNSLAKSLNELAGYLNLNVAKYNEIGGSHGEEFEEGVYERDADGERINIYQFESKEKLMRVLAHEFGHALGLDHVEDSQAIMYRLNNGVNQKLTEADISALSERCNL